MAAPVAVALPAGPLDSSLPILVDANEPLVAATPFIPWAPVPAAAGAGAQVSMTFAQACRCFISRCSVGPLPADITAARAATAFRLRFSGAFWSRVLTELRDSGLFAVLIPSLRLLDEKRRSLDIGNPVNLLVVAADWLLTADFTLPTGAGAASVARRAVMTPMRFINLVNAVTLQQGQPEPFQRLADLVCYLGSCGTSPAREDESGLPRAAAACLREAGGSAAMADGVRARAVPTLLDRIRLPTALRSMSLNEDDLGMELVDGIAFRSSAASKDNIIEQRIQCLGDRSVVPPLPRTATCTLGVAARPRAQRSHRRGQGGGRVKRYPLPFRGSSNSMPGAPPINGSHPLPCIHRNARVGRGGGGTLFRAPPPSRETRPRGSAGKCPERRPNRRVSARARHLPSSWHPLSYFSWRMRKSSSRPQKVALREAHQAALREASLRDGGVGIPFARVRQRDDHLSQHPRGKGPARPGSPARRKGGDRHSCRAPPSDERAPWCRERQCLSSQRGPASTGLGRSPFSLYVAP